MSQTIGKGTIAAVVAVVVVVLGIIAWRVFGPPPQPSAAELEAQTRGQMESYQRQMPGQPGGAMPGTPGPGGAMPGGAPPPMPPGPR